MAVIKREPKASNLMIPLKPSVRAMAEKRAAEEGRSLATYISQLIVADSKASGSDRRKKGFSD
jgi:predicted HicB family RNase H-like nuclease